MARDEDPLWEGLDRPGDQLAAESARARSHRRWLAQLAAESATMAGILLTLAEHEEPVTVHCGPWTHRGLLRRVGSGTCVLEEPEAVVLLVTAAVTRVDSSRAVADDRMPPEGPDVGTALADLAAHHPAVRLQLDDGSELAGVLAAVGKDVAQLRVPPTTASVRLPAIACALLPLGRHPV